MVWSVIGAVINAENFSRLPWPSFSFAGSFGRSRFFFTLARKCCILIKTKQKKEKKKRVSFLNEGHPGLMGLEVFTGVSSQVQI